VVPRGRSGITCESLDNSEREEPYGSLKKKKIALTVDMARKLQTVALGAPAKRTSTAILEQAEERFYPHPQSGKDAKKCQEHY
jgi:hypothetical protein